MPPIWRTWVRDHRRLAVSIGAATALVLAASWLVVTTRTADRVSTTWTPHCTGTTVGTYHGSLMIRSRPGWRCTLTVDVRNDSGRAVHVSHIAAPFLGSAGGGEVRGYSTAHAAIHDSSGDGGEVDAIYDTDLTVPAHATRSVALAVGWRQSGCNDAGTLAFDHWPVIVFDTAFRTFHGPARQKFVLRTYNDAHDRTACDDGGA